MQDPSNAGLRIHFHLTDGSIHSFLRADGDGAVAITDEVNPAKLYLRPRIVVGSEHSKSVFVSSEIVRIDFISEAFQCWEFPAGYSDIVELSREEFRKYARLDELESRPKRAQPTPAGDLLVSFSQLNLRGGATLFVMVEFVNTLPAESESFMNFLLSKDAIHMRLRGGGIGVLNLANLASYTVYPGVAQIPSDAWLAEPTYS